MAKLILAGLAAGIVTALSASAACAATYEFVLEQDTGTRISDGTSWSITQPFTLVNNSPGYDQVNTVGGVTGDSGITTPWVDFFSNGSALIIGEGNSGGAYLSSNQGAFYSNSPAPNFSLAFTGLSVPGTETISVEDLSGGRDNGSYSLTISAVPELSTWAMMLVGFAGLGFAGYRASRKSAALAV
jgi:hypothetical protein